MAFEFQLPDVGEGVVEAEILTWLVAEGDVVEVDQPIVEISTDKVVVEIPSPVAGIVLKIHYQVGEICPVHEVLVVIGDGDESSLPADDGPEVDVAEPPAEVQPEPEEPAELPESQRILAIPSTRRLAKELEVGLETVPSTGKGGRVTSADVRKAAEQDSTPPPEPAAPPRPPSAEYDPATLEQRIPLRGARKAIADNMVRSAFTATHFTYVEEVDMTGLVALRDQLKGKAAERGVKLTYLPFISKAIADALKRFPALNASLDDEARQIVLKGYVHLGIAVQGPHGLTVTVVRDADRLSVLELGGEINRLGDAVRDGTITMAEMKGSTFTISSLGVLGGVMATPIINHPEVGIVGVHRVAHRPAVVDGEIVPRWLMNLSISLDHRVVDGWDGAMFLQDVKAQLEEPLGLLL